jgi:hypothetical protein
MCRLVEWDFTGEGWGELDEGYVACIQAIIPVFTAYGACIVRRRMQR